MMMTRISTMTMMNDRSIAERARRIAEIFDGELTEHPREQEHAL